MAREGLPFIFIPLAVGLVFAGYGWWLPAILFICFSLFSAWFFRDPERSASVEDSAVLSPADGVVIKLEEVDDQRFLKQRAVKISIFMSVFNVHVNRIPFSGSIEDIQYFPGKFVSANLDKASAENEHNAVILKTDNGAKIAFVQIAGLIARRIVCWISQGDRVTRGSRFGLIRFGSRLDVYLPTTTRTAVEIGQKVRAGQTVLGFLS